jgi:hypothetical protein
MSFSADEFFFKSPTMAGAFPEFPDALTNFPHANNDLRLISRPITSQI